MAQSARSSNQVPFFRLKGFADSAAGPAGEKRRVYTFHGSDGEFDRYQDRLDVKGWDLKAFNDNPVILLNHDAGNWSGALPIGKGKAYVEGDVLLIDVEFDMADAKAAEVARKLDGGFLNTGSVRYLMKKYHENERGGLDCSEHELLEFSIVTIPGNARAVRKKDADESDAAFADAVATRVLERLNQKAAPPAPSTPEPFEVDVSQLAAAIAAEITTR